MSDDREQRAKAIFERATQAATGCIWVWNDTGDEVRERFRALADEGGFAAWQDKLERELGAGYLDIRSNRKDGSAPQDSHPLGT